MLSENEARKLGIRACMEKIGFDFCMKNKENSSTAYGLSDGKMFCFVGVNDNAKPDKSDTLLLTSLKDFPYTASCNVDMNDGYIEFCEC